ncbi:PAS domain S-box protein [Stieleria sp. JC731]|uniref:PAS domain S-box protein n=1 Tax=Pirellulaceae TaxID=2691357 RepID=UPI001E5DA27F|nr:PAS domain S-box protein [Stieleria sp. JC731]MCC9602759.1 PAS domain S-box protein [Stieleria sp. JC731]
MKREGDCGELMRSKLLQQFAPAAIVIDQTRQIIDRHGHFDGFVNEDLLGQQLSATLPSAILEILDQPLATTLNSGNSASATGSWFDGNSRRHLQVLVQQIAAESEADFSSISDLGDSEPRYLVTFEDVTQVDSLRRNVEDKRQRLALATQASSMGVFDLDPQTDELIASEVFCSLFGKRPGSLTHGEQLFSQIHENDAAEVRKRVADACTNCTEYNAEFRVRRDPKRVNWIVMRGKYIRDSDGKTSLIGVAWDATERRQLERSLARSRREVEIALTAGGLGTWKWDIGSDLVTWSDSLHQLLGFGNEEFGGTFGAFRELVHPDDTEKVEREIQKTLVGRCDDYHIECRMRHQGGKWLWVCGDGSVERDSQGNPTLLIGAIMDITDQKRIERRLKAKSRQLRSVTDAMPALIALIDTEEKIQFANEAFAAQFSCTVDEAVGKSVFEILGEETYKSLQSNLMRSLAGERCKFELPLLQDGGSVIKDVTFIPEFDTDENQIGVYVLATDVTHRKRYEQRLKENQVYLLRETQKLAEALTQISSAESKLRVLFDQSFFYTGVIDLEGNLIDINEAATVPFGFASDEVLGTKFWDTPWWTGHPDSQTKLQHHFKDALQGKPYREVIAFNGPGGILRYTDFIYQPAIGDDGEIQFVVATGQDVTESIVQQAQIRKSEQRLRLALNAADLKLWQWNVGEDRWFSSFGEEASSGQLASRPTDSLATFIESIHPEDRARVESKLCACLDDRTAFREEYRVVRDSKTRWILALAHVSIDEDDAPLQLIGVELDITDRKLTELKLDEARRAAEEANVSKSAFLANMSHEIRTPMTAILGYTELAQSTGDARERDEHLSTIRRNGYYLLEIINDILDLSKIEAGKIEIARQRFEPASLVADVQSIMSVRAAENQLELEVQYDGLLPEVIRTDPKRLKQILINLIGNAIKFTKQGGVTVTVRYIEGDEGYLEFQVSDTGIGMTQKQQNLLFEPFTQGDARINRQFGGTGLGLAISQRLANILGGEINCESKIGEGSTFTFQVKAPPLPGVTMVSPIKETVQKRSEYSVANIRLEKRILVVDDRPDIRLLSKRILTKAGATVVEAVDGLDAIDRYNESVQANKTIDCIILDMQMPRLDGYRTASRLRKMDFHGPIIAVTAEAMDGDSNRCIASGCDDYLSKPIDANKLLRLVDGLCDDN